MTATAPQVTPGRLYGVGVGPGDPDLVTVKAARLIAEADVVAFPVARRASRGGVAREIARPHMRDGVVELPLLYPVTVEGTDHPGGYEGALVDYYDDSAAEIAVHLDAGRDVVVLCAGDPFFYGSYMYLHERLADRYVTEVVPGVTSFSASAAASGTPLAKRDDVVTILPGTLPPAVLTERLRDADAAVVMKLGRTFGQVTDAAEAAGVADRAVYVERASSPVERTCPLRDVDADTVPYMSLVLVPTGPGTFADEAPAGSAATGSGASGDGATVGAGTDADRAAVGVRTGRVDVVGLGPAGDDWRTPEAAAALESADVIVGYRTYVDRVPVRVGQRRLDSDNRVEIDRARQALELAAAGERVAVVSSGDPGIFAMAAAVYEVVDAEPDAFAAVDVRVVPGLSAMQVAAARVGAPLGHDFAVVSLSDILKPWDVVERRLAAAASSDLALALYNPASRTRREQLERALATLRRHRDPDTPVVVARAVGAREEAVTITTLAAVDPAVVDMRTILIVGSSRTRVMPGDGDGRPDRVYTPRSYPVG
ncbi:MAG: precorrin-3B C(17)-methyltransferase [Solirubrobacteraceae bacterium]|nr:precorrin-3B C(17)-methyltransferase [Solirubrobacteraceae bacterium]